MRGPLSCGFHVRGEGDIVLWWLEWGTRDSRLQGKVPNSGCGESESQPKGDESLHCCHFCILSGTYLPRLAQMETESHPYRWPEIAKPSSPSPAPANTNCLRLLPPLPATNSRLYTHTALQTQLPPRSPPQPGGASAFPHFLLVLKESTYPLSS